MSPTDEELDELKARLAKLEKPPKDYWDRLQVIGTLLVPAAVALAGYLFTTAMKQAEIESAAATAAAQLQIEQLRSDRDHAIATINARLGQGGFVRSLLDDLLSPDARKQKLASEAILIVLPEDGARLLRALQMTGSPEVQRSATAALNSRRPILIDQLYADSGSVRQAAYQALLSGWANDSTIVPELIATARENAANQNGVYNTLVFLSHMNRESLRPHLALVNEFSREMEGAGPRTKTRAELLQRRLPQ